MLSSDFSVPLLLALLRCSSSRAAETKEKKMIGMGNFVDKNKEKISNWSFQGLFLRRIVGNEEEFSRKLEISSRTRRKFW